MKKIINKKKGFTLIELIIVIAIIAILAAVTVPRLSGFRDDAKESADKANMKIIQNATSMLIANDDIKLPSNDVTIMLVANDTASTVEAGINNEIVAKLQEIPKTSAGGEFYVTINHGNGNVTVDTSGTATTTATGE